MLRFLAFQMLQLLSKQEADEWLGFSPRVTEALEEVYQTWLQEALKKAAFAMTFVRQREEFNRETMLNHVEPTTWVQILVAGSTYVVYDSLC